MEAALQGAERIRESHFSQKKGEEEKRKMSNQLASKTYDKHSLNWMHETPESCLDLMTLDFVQALETYTKQIIDFRNGCQVALSAVHLHIHPTH